MTYAEEEEAGCSHWVTEERIVKKKPRKRRFELQAILREEIVREQLPLIEYYTAAVQDKCTIGPLLQILPPMPSEANHLKRIRDGQILIHPATEPLSEDLLEKLRSAHGASIEKVLVPACKPVTRRQFLWAKHYWPTSFHPNERYEALLSGNFFTTEEQKRIIEFYLESEKIGGGGPGCVIVDLKGEVVAKSGVRNVPLGHAVMSAISDLCEKHRTGDSDVLQYLGTGYDVYMTDEPCAMCAMALVHFRVGRVFYGKRSAKSGVYESCWRIQEEKQLNHHYSVFRIDELFDV
ncbi:unnamed protein product [Gongylonema pulchrum]|uniref:CMP/dCMP-type deaminase domain-containing protein n=1 Tax=Gongylonema pulchrum TaxID=637853 RepID=A0A183DSF4_9BILA|nr:unnamed protein product [Gongylonema pulchrum]